MVAKKPFFVCETCARELAREQFPDVLYGDPPVRHRRRSCQDCLERFAAIRAATTYPEAPNPSGLCQCGCGQVAPIAAKTERRKGCLQGYHKRFVAGHNFRSNAPEYIVDPATGCWEWQRAKNRGGYGFRGSSRSLGSNLAHRIVYERFRGPIPEGLVLDHLCRNPGCVNPDHLEPVPARENSHRGRKTKLTQQQVDEIRAIGRSMRQIDIAATYGVARTTVAGILNGKRWPKES